MGDESSWATACLVAASSSEPTDTSDSSTCRLISALLLEIVNLVERPRSELELDKLGDESDEPNEDGDEEAEVDNAATTTTWSTVTATPLLLRSLDELVRDESADSADLFDLVEELNELM